MATRSCYRLFKAKEKRRIIEEAENIENRAAGRKYVVSKKVVFVTDAENKTRLAENNSNRRAFRGQEARHLELEKKAVRLRGR